MRKPEDDIHFVWRMRGSLGPFGHFLFAAVFNRNPDGDPTLIDWTTYRQVVQEGTR